MSYRYENRVHCKTCKWYKIGGSAERCIIEENIASTKTWRGVVYKQHPTHRNYNLKCKTYEERKEHEGEER